MSKRRASVDFDDRGTGTLFSGWKPGNGAHDLLSSLSFQHAHPTSRGAVSLSPKSPQGVVPWRNLQ
jgi:hypothetical protein